MKTKPKTDGDLRSSALPGGSLIRALLDRRLMGLADMGGASGIVGERWSDVVAAHVDTLAGAEVGIPGGMTHVIDRVVRLDALPHVAAAASKRSLQNPDFVLLGHSNGRPTMQAADAKFSIETARSKQVSVEMLSALNDIGHEYTDLLGDWHETSEVVPGLFFAPRSPLSTYVLSGGRGITRSTIRPEEVVLLEASAAELTNAIPGGAVRRRLARVDGLVGQLDTELLVGLYYTRLSSAAGASWFDMHRPLFGSTGATGPDFEAVEREIDHRMNDCRSGFELIDRWAEDAERVRSDRHMIDQAAALPIPNRELREWVQTDAEIAGLESPSLNRVRKALQRWAHKQILDEIGIILPDQQNINSQVARIRTLVTRMAVDARSETTQIVIALGEPSEFTCGGREEVQRGE